MTAHDILRIPPREPSASATPVAPADAAPEIKRIAKYISHKSGGAGVARDVIEQTMKAQGRWMGDEAFGW